MMKDFEGPVAFSHKDVSVIDKHPGRQASHRGVTLGLNLTLAGCDTSWKPHGSVLALQGLARRNRGRHGLRSETSGRTEI